MVYQKKIIILASMPDLTGFVTWDRLEDALKGIRESIEKSSHAALASERTYSITRTSYMNVKVKL